MTKIEFIVVFSARKEKAFGSAQVGHGQEEEEKEDDFVCLKGKGMSFMVLPIMTFTQGTEELITQSYNRF